MDSAEPESIGAVMMNSDRSLSLTLRAEGDDGAIGDVRLTIGPNETMWATVVNHVGGLSPGDSKVVPPWR